jgi:hypothetical protein
VERRTAPHTHSAYHEQHTGVQKHKHDTHTPGYSCRAAARARKAALQLYAHLDGDGVTDALGVMDGVGNVDPVGVLVEVWVDVEVAVDVTARPEPENSRRRSRDNSGGGMNNGQAGKLTIAHGLRLEALHLPPPAFTAVCSRVVAVGEQGVVFRGIVAGPGGTPRRHVALKVRSTSPHRTPICRCAALRCASLRV